MQVEQEAAERLRQEVAGGKRTAVEKKTSLTDPEAGFLRGRGGKFCLGYSGELAVSADHFIVAVRVTQQAADNASLLAMGQEVERHCGGQPQPVLADSGFYSGDNREGLEERGIDGYVPDSNLGREINLGRAVQDKPRLQPRASRRMRHKLRTSDGRRTYLQRKTLVEPGIGGLKQQRGMRQFLRVGLAAVRTELLLAAISYHLTHCHCLRR